MPLNFFYSMMQKKLNMTKNSNQGGPALRCRDSLPRIGSILCTFDTITSLNASNLVRERERERERENGEQSRRRVGQVGTMAAVNSRDKNRLEKRSSRRAWCTFGRHFSLRRARCSVAQVRRLWRRCRRLFAVGKNFLFSSLAWQLGQRIDVYFAKITLYRYNVKTDLT